MTISQPRKQLRHLISYHASHRIADKGPHATALPQHLFIGALLAEELQLDPDPDETHTVTEQPPRFWGINVTVDPRAKPLSCRARWDDADEVIIELPSEPELDVQP